MSRRHRWAVVIIGAVLLGALLPASAALGQVVPPIGGNFLVNTYTTLSQLRPAAAVVDVDGSFVVVWDREGDGDNQGIFARRYDADGAPVGAQFVVNTTTADEQSYPDVASDLAGNFVVVWQGRRAAYYGNTAIFGQRFDDSGPVGGEFVIVTDIGYYQYNAQRPSVSVDLGGEFVVVWQNTDDAVGDNFRLLGQLFDRDGDPVGDEFLVSPDDQVPNARPDVAKNLASGDFVVVWELYGGCTSDGGSICARRFDSAATPLGDQFQVEQDTSGFPGDADVAADFEGNFIVVWSQLLGGGTTNIFGKRFDSAGSVVNSDFQINTYTPDSQEEPAVTAGDLDGNFVVAWESFENGADEVRARWLADNFQDEGVTEVEDFLVNSYLTGIQREPALASDLNGNFVVVWQGPGAGDTDTGIFGQRYSPPVEVEVNDFSVEEGDPTEDLESTAVFSVQVSEPHPSGATVTVDFFTEDDDATFLEDYTNTSGSLSFTPSDPLAQPVEVPITGDLIFEADESFLLNLTNVGNAVIVRSPGVGTILNDDAEGVLTISDEQVTEGAAGTSQQMTFTLTLTPPQQLDASVNFQTVDESATGGDDYESTAGVVSIPAGFSQAFVTVEIFGDDVFEGDETFLLQLFDPVNAQFLGGGEVESGQGTILSDEPCPPISIDPTSMSFLAAGGSGEIQVSDGGDCGWTAVSNDPWITITGGAGGTGDGTVQYSVAENDGADARQGTITVAEVVGGAELTFQVTQEGTLCNFTVSPLEEIFPRIGGTGAVTVTASEPFCTWTAVSNDPWITITSAPGGTGDGAVDFTVDENDGFQRQGTMAIAVNTVAIDQDGIFFDDFDDDVLSEDWIYAGESFWSEANSRLRADPTEEGEEAQAIARPAFIGCVECTISAEMRVNIFSRGLATLLGWYLNDDNLVSLTMDEFADTWTLTQRVGGSDVATMQAGGLAIEVGVDYAVEVDFDGTSFSVRVDEVLAIVMPAAAGTTPDGTVGFRVAETDADFDEVMAVPVTTGNLPATVEITAPADGSSLVDGIPIDFAGSAFDPEDGDISAALAWTSDLDGAIGSGGAFTTTLSLGIHEITAEVLDSGELPAFRSITVTVVPNMPPVVVIVSPPDGSTFVEGTDIAFSGTAIDDGDGDISAALAWTSDLDGAIGSGGAFTATLSLGVHAVTAAVTDSGGLAGADSITLTVLPEIIFEDGFESGDTSAWSASVP